MKRIRRYTTNTLIKQFPSTSEIRKNKKIKESINKGDERQCESAVALRNIDACRWRTIFQAKTTLPKLGCAGARLSRKPRSLNAASAASGRTFCASFKFLATAIKTDSKRGNGRRLLCDIILGLRSIDAFCLVGGALNVPVAGIAILLATASSPSPGVRRFDI